MAKCAECGNDVFVGEARCPTCKTPVPGAAPTVVDDGPRDDGYGNGLPLNGASLLVQKGVADQDSWRDHEPPPGTANAYGLTVGGYDDDAPADLDAIADAFKAERDAQGRVIWDWKYALIGGIVVAILLGIGVFVVTGYVDGLTNGSKLSRIS